MIPPRSQDKADFFGRLLGRASDDPAAIEPRLPSLFEPAGPGQPLGIERPIAPAAPPLRPTLEPQVVTSVQRSATHIDVARAPREKLPSARSQPDVASSPSVTTAEVAAMADQPGPPFPSLRHHEERAEIRREAVRVPVARAPASEALAAPPLSPDVRSPALPLREVLRFAPAAKVADERRAPALREPTNERLLAEPPRAVTALARWVQPARRDAQPAVNVSIGRLEIRATAPKRESPSAVASPKASQPLSLEDYMKQRAGGR